MSSSFTFLTDFDGVWTNPFAELQAVHACVRSELGRLGGHTEEAMLPLYQQFRAEVLAHPERHGWRLGGRLASYVDEDYFAVPTSIGQYIDEAPCEASQHLRAAILQEWDSVLAFLDHCYHSTCNQFRTEVEHDLTEGAERVLQWLLHEKVQVVFGTNAPAEKVIDWFAHHGYAVVDGRSTEPGEYPLRVYGRSGKQWLGEEAQTLDFCGRQVECNRPQYREILEREEPDLVVGDVLSLDLAQPIALRNAGATGGPREVGVMHLRHTPDWVLNSIGPGPAQVNHLVAHITALPRIVTKLRGSAPPTAG